MVDQLLGREHTALLAAGYKTGKTTLLLNLLQSLTDEQLFLNRFETHLEAGRVIWFNYELTEEQAQRWAQDMGISQASRAAYVGLRGLPNPLASDAGREWIVNFLKQNETAIWFIDTFRASFFGESINDLADVARYTSLIDEIKHEAGVSESIVTHHFGRKEHERGQEHGLGSVELDAWTDMRWLLTRAKDDRFFAVEGRSAGLQESALMYDDHTRRLAIELGIGREQKKAESQAENKQKNIEELEKAILKAIKKEPGISSSGIQEVVEGRKATILALVKDLKMAGKIKVETGGSGLPNAHFIP